MGTAAASLEWVKASWGERAVTVPRPVEQASPQVARNRTLRYAAALVVLGATLSADAVAFFSPPAATPLAASGGVALWQSASGLVEAQGFGRSMPLRDLNDAFAFSGSASPGVGYAVSGNQGLSIGVRIHPYQFEGWFAVTRASFPVTGVYHVTMSKPPGNVRGNGNQGEAVFAVQTGTTKQTGFINYVVVSSNSAKGVTTWIVGYAHGKVADAHLEVLATLPIPPGSPSTRAITLTTDGTKTLSVWFGDHLVYSSGALRLAITPPFQPYLEVQSERIPYHSVFRNLWITSGTILEVAAPSGAELRLVGHAGATLAEGISHGGLARLAVSPPEARGRATLVVRSEGRQVTLGPFSYAGGGRYQLSGMISAGQPAVGRG